MLKHYVKAGHPVGLHFQSYDEYIFGPVVKKEIRNAEPADRNYITVYLPSYCEPQLMEIFHLLPAFQFEIFSKETRLIRKEKNIRFLPVNKQLFNQSMVNCTGIISGAGFETPAEALHLGKKIMVIPIRGQYEQQCNAAALQQMGITCLSQIDAHFSDHFINWIQWAPAIKKDYSNSIPQCLDRLFTLADQMRKEPPTQQSIISLQKKPPRHVLPGWPLHEKSAPDCYDY